MIDLSAELQEPPTYIPPSLNEACLSTAELWPQRLSPQSMALPLTSEPPPPQNISLAADSGAALGKLLLELTLWMADGVIDLTSEKPSFTPPPNTYITLPPGMGMPADFRFLGAFETTYSM